MKTKINILRQARSKRALHARKGVAFALCLFASISYQGLAFAQNSTDSRDDLPIAASPSPVPAQELPVQVQPVQLDAPKTYALNPENIRRRRANNRNAWSTKTLTQSTGLNASRIEASAIHASNKQYDPKVMPTDVLSTNILLGMDDKNLPTLAPLFAAPALNDGLINFDPSLRGVLFDTPGDIGVNQSVFKLDLGGQFCLGTASECDANITKKIALSYAKNITHGKRGGLNLQLTPRAGFRFDENSKSALVGALVRIGDDLRLGSEMKSNTWYVFAGADAEAVTYAPDAGQRLTGGQYHLQDRIIIGDAQAGLGYRIGGADLALTYFKRQAKTDTLSYNEDAAAFSITWKR